MAGTPNTQSPIELLQGNGYSIISDNYGGNVLFHRYIDRNEFFLLLILPRMDNGCRYGLRGDFAETHDKWSNAQFQRVFSNEEDFKENWNKFWLFEG